jgi:integrase
MIGWHTLRHTYRSWMDNNGTPLGIQKDLMRHTDIKMTMIWVWKCHAGGDA